MAENCSSPSPGPDEALAARAILIGGATAVGKSAIALRLAEMVGGEIVSVDSMQVYRGLDIGTAKATRDERSRVRHHLIDILDLNECFDASRFVRRARAAIQEILERQRVPILCGGTGFYFKALIEGIPETPPAAPALREELRATPLPVLLSELRRSDPACHEAIDRQNLRRVIRAIEFIRLTGRPFSDQKRPRRMAAHPCFHWISRGPGDLRARVENRVETMFREGLVAETRALLGQGLASNITAMQALGYRQVVDHLRGLRSLEETVELVKIRTWQFARRQMTWFRTQIQAKCLRLEPAQSPDESALQIAADWRQAEGDSRRRLA